MIVYVCFIRKDGCKVERGYIAGQPTLEFPPTSEPFIVCKVDSSSLSPSDLEDDSIRLDLAKLQKANTTKVVTDEDGNNQTITVYNYYDVGGTSSEENAPLITFADVKRG